METQREAGRQVSSQWNSFSVVKPQNGPKQCACEVLKKKKDWVKYCSFVRTFFTVSLYISPFVFVNFSIVYLNFYGTVLRSFFPLYSLVQKTNK